MNGNDGCVLLAGGAGRRMGHINKAELKWKGSTFSERIRREMEKTGCRCYISAAEYALFVPEGWTLVRDPEWILKGSRTVPDGSSFSEDGSEAVSGRGQSAFSGTDESREHSKECRETANDVRIGPVGGIYACLKKAEEDGLRGLFFVPCDAPLYRAELSLKLAKYIHKGTEAVCWRTKDKKIQPAFGWYSVGCIPVFEEVIRDGKYRLMKTLERFQLTIVETEDEGVEESCFLNINSPADYERLSSLPG